MPMWRYTEETPRDSQVFGRLEDGDLVESETPPHLGSGWFEPVPDTVTIDVRRLRPVSQYPWVYEKETAE
jgi:hypothetical protein